MVRGSGVQSVERAVAILDHLARGGSSLSSISELLGVTLPGAAKLLRTLEDSGLVSQDESRQYVLASGVCRFARAYLGGTGLVEMSREVLHELSVATGNHTILAVFEGQAQVNLLRVDGQSGWRHLGSEIPERIGWAWPQATGRVLLAHCSRGFVEDHFRVHGHSCEAGVGELGWAGVLQVLEGIRDAGHAVVESPVRELVFVAAPVRSPNGAVIAALGAHAVRGAGVEETIAQVVSASADAAVMIGP